MAPARSRLRLPAALALLLLVVAGFLVVLLPRWRLENYLRSIDREPLLAQVALRRLGTRALLPIAREVASRFTAEPVTGSDSRRFHIVEELVHDHEDHALALARDPTIDPDVRRMLSTFCASRLERDELWDLAAYWVSQQSRWAEEALFWIWSPEDAPFEDEAHERLHSQDESQRMAASLALVLAGHCTGTHEFVRWLCERVDRPEWYARAVRCLIDELEAADLPCIEECMLGENAELRVEALWALGFSDYQERIPMLLRVVERTEGGFRRDCFALFSDLLGELDDGDGEKLLGAPLATKLDPYLDDADLVIRTDALWLVHPDGDLAPETALRVTKGLTAPELVDSGLYYFLKREALLVAARELAPDFDVRGEARYREVLLSVFPPLAAMQLVSLLEAADGDNQLTTQAAFFRLPLRERLPALPALIEKCSDRPETVSRVTLTLLASRAVPASLDEPHRAAGAALLWRAVDPDNPANVSVYVDQDMRLAAARMAAVWGGETGKRSLRALVELADEDERAAYEQLLQGLE